MVLNKDLREFIALLNEHGVEYLVIGGYAVGYYGYPRYTGDIDLWVKMELANAQKALAAIKSFGFESLGLTKEDLLDPENVVQLGFVPNRIDLLTDLPGVTFETCYAKRKHEVMDGLHIDFIDLESLLIVKKEAGRPQDMLDVKKLLERKAKENRKNKQ